MVYKHTMPGFLLPAIHTAFSPVHTGWYTGAGQKCEKQSILYECYENKPAQIFQ